MRLYRRLQLPGDLPVRAVTVERLTGWELADPELRSAEVRASPDESRAGNQAGPGAGALAGELTAEQEQAITRRGEPLLLAAGAGSGKTSVLVERFVRAVGEDGVAPARILAITFTERAAGELRERVRARLQGLGETQAAFASEHAYVGTFHGFCARILRTHAREAGLAQEHEILDEALAGRLRRLAFTEALGGFLQGERTEAVDLIAAYGADRVRANVLGAYGELRSRGRRTPRLPAPNLEHPPLTLEEAGGQKERRAQRALDEQAALALALWDELLQRFGERYEAAKWARNGLDFDDLELRAGELLARDPDVRQAWAERFELLMVDELQDVNPRQLALMQALERENLFTVGDEWQSIYGFRHADVSLFRAREAHLAPRGQSLRLMHNFRGRPELLQTVNAVFTARFGGAFTPLRAGRERAREQEIGEDPSPRVELLLTDRRGWAAEQAQLAGAGAGAGAGTGSGTGASAGAPSWREAEAQALAERVAELVRTGLARPGAVAVLLRGMGDIECYEQALRAQGLSTLASAGVFWERQEVADLLAYLRALADPADEVALYGALAAPPVDLSSDGLALLARAAQAQGRGVWNVACDLASGTGAGENRDAERTGAGEGSRTGSGGAPGPDAWQEQLSRTAQFCAWLGSEREIADELTLAQLLERGIEHGGHLARMAVGEGAERRLANVRKLMALAEEWEHSEGRDLRGFLDEAAFQQGAGGRLASAEAIAEPDAPTADLDRDAVRLMSVHAAKGLEFETVCIADLGRAPSMSLPDLLVSDGRIGVRMVGLEDPEPQPALEFAALAQERRDAQAEEEDRIVYVAMTRARERLLLSGAVDFASWPRERPGAAPIVWLAPALSPAVPALCAQARAEPLISAVAHVISGHDAASPEDTAPSPGVASVNVLADASRQSRQLTVEGTDVPMLCRLNTPGPGA